MTQATSLRSPFHPSTLLLLALAGACQDPAVPAAGTEADESSSSTTGAPPPSDVTGSTDAADASGADESSTGTDDTGGPVVCGNGIVEAGESCDDEGQSETCDEDCTPVDCGDGLVNPMAGEQCDERGASPTCTAECTVPDVGCGDGVIQPGEQCDDGVASAFCDTDCTVVECGDGIINPIAEEQCDTGGESPMCDVDCTLAMCGDGMFNASAGEECDGAGRTAACNADCTLWECGDGLLNVAAGEACDDAGESLLCNADCTLWECGDGITNVTAGEDCDDAGESLTCDIDCTSVLCGDGITNVTAGEDCDDTGESPTCNVDCSAVLCGDGLVNAAAGELCDDAGPSLTCDVDCTPAMCGDAVANAVLGEDCDGADLAGESCPSIGYGVGVLACGAQCAYDAVGCTPSTPTLNLALSQVKRFDFSWVASLGAGYYQLLESASPGDPYVQVGGDIVGTATSIDVPLHFRLGASYLLRACNVAGCTDSAAVDVVGSLAEAVGYFKASNTGAGDQLYSVALSADGNTLAVGASGEDSIATGIGGNQADNTAAGAGAVYVFVRNGVGSWSQQAYIKASNTDAGDNFGTRVALSANGNTLAVGALGEDSIATGIGGNQADDTSADSGAAYVFTRNGAGTWSQQAYVKASNSGAGDAFGRSVALSSDGNTLAVGASWEDSIATGIGGNQADNSAGNAGAVYTFTRNGAGTWSQQAYIKASNTGSSDVFGRSVALSADGTTLAVSAEGEDSSATGIGGNGGDNAAVDAGAVYVYVRNGIGVWSPQAYVKASNTGASDSFGVGLALSGDGNTLAVGTPNEDSNATGIGGNQADNAAGNAGATYVFSRNIAGTWSQQAYLKASNTGASDVFGADTVLSTDGNILAVGAYLEDSSATGVAGDQLDNGAGDSGAVYVFVRDELGAWSQRTYLKAPTAGAGDRFGARLAMSGSGHTIATSAYLEDSNAVGIAGSQADNTIADAGAVYLY